MSAQDGKDLFTSRTTWGVIAQIVAALALQAGYDVGDTEGWAEAIAVVVTGVYALWGRYSAVKPITSVAGVKVEAKE